MFLRIFFLVLAEFYLERAQSAAEKSCRRALTSFSVLSNIRRVSRGSRGMSRTSRCFAALFFQLGGPNALIAAEPFLCPRLADFSFAGMEVCRPEKFLSTTRAAKCGDFVFRVMNKFGTNGLAAARRTKLLATARRSTDHNARGEGGGAWRCRRLISRTRFQEESHGGPGLHVG